MFRWDFSLMLAATKVVLTAALALWVSGCVTRDQEEAARSYAALANRRLDDRDIQMRMSQRARILFPKVSEADDQAYREGKKILAPRPVSTPIPNYPLAKQLNLTQAEVWVAFVVGPDGAVVDARALVGEAAPPDPTLEASAVGAVRRWIFRPGTIDGRPSSFVFCLPILFQMQF